MNNIQTEQLKVSKGQLGVSQGQLKVSQANQALSEDTAGLNKVLALKRDAREDKRADQTVPQGLKPAKDKDGNLVYIDTTKLKADANGVVKLPQGLTPINAKTEPSDAAVASLAAKIMEDPKQRKMVDGKRVPLTPAEAGIKARDVLRKQGGDASEDPADRLIRLMRAAQAGSAVDSEVE
jgi:hypothetical protein